MRFYHLVKVPASRLKLKVVFLNSKEVEHTISHDFFKFVLDWMLSNSLSVQGWDYLLLMKKLNIPPLLPSYYAHSARFPPDQAGLGRLSNIQEINRRNLGLVLVHPVQCK